MVIEPSLLKYKSWVVRAQYGHESLALIAALYEAGYASNPSVEIIIVDVQTGWAAEGWEQYCHHMRERVQQMGFKTHTITLPSTYDEMVRRRLSFPTSKFQWCATLLKGASFTAWLDQYDPNEQAAILIAKRQASVRASIPAIVLSCPHHGERNVYHPIAQMSTPDRDRLLQAHKLFTGYDRSLECQPCVNITSEELKQLPSADLSRLTTLENEVGTGCFPVGLFGPSILTKDKIQWLKQQQSVKIGSQRENFYRGCGEFYGCGL